MKTFSEYEHEAARLVIENEGFTFEQANKIVNKIFDAIEAAEPIGVPAPPVDKYIAAKEYLQANLNNLNSSITDAARLGMVVTIADTSKQLPPVQVAYPPNAAQAPMYPGAPAITKPWAPVPKFALERIYKDF